MSGHPAYERITADHLKGRVLQNSRGDRVTLLNLGARLASVELQLADGPRNLIVGYDNVADYLDDPYYMGATVGRYCNRIAAARFSLGGIEYQLDANEGQNHLHGGAGGFHNKLWSMDSDVPSDVARFRVRSPDGDQGYPGMLEASVTYRWTDDRVLVIELEAETDEPTHVNMTNHAYFNLAAGEGDILGHRLRVDSGQILEVNDELLPTGGYRDVNGSALDLREPAVLGEVIEAQEPLLVRTGGIDFNYVLGKSDAVAELESPNGDLRLRMTTTCPGLQVYTGQMLGSPFAAYRALCLEPQHYPDTPNQAHFPQTLLSPGERYSQVTHYQFIASN